MSHVFIFLSDSGVKNIEVSSLLANGIVQTFGTMLSIF